MEPKILLIFAQPEESLSFINAIRLYSTKNSDYEHDIQEYEISTHENGRLKFNCYTLPEMGMESVLNYLPKILIDTRPNLVVNIGIAGGVMNDFKIGDVIIGNSIFSYINNSKIYDSKDGLKISPATHERHSDPGLLNLFVNFINRNPKFTPTYNNYKELFFSKSELDSIKYVPKVNKGQIITGPWVDVSEGLKELYKQISRKIAVVEMEAAYIQNVVDSYNQINEADRIKTFYIKGISDLATPESKDEISELQKTFNRKYALFNTAMVFKRFVNNIKIITTPSPYNYLNIDEIFNEKHLKNKRHYKEIKLNDNQVLFENFFRNFITYKNPSPFTDLPLFEEIYKISLSSTTNLALKIKGFSGSGKSSLLISFFNYLYKKFNNDFVTFPIYLNLDYYYLNFNKSLDIHTYVLKSFELDIHNCEKIIKGLKLENIILIIDGIDYDRDSSDLIGYFQHISRFNDYAIKIVFGVQSISEKTVLNFRIPINQIRSSNSIEIINMKYDDPSLLEAIKTFTEIKGEIDDTKAVELYRKIISIKFQDIDLFIISLLYDNIERLNSMIHHLQKDYCNSICIKSDVTLDDISKSAFNHHIERPRDNESINYDPAVWKITRQNPQVIYYLIATQVINNILHVDKNSSLFFKLGFVYPFQINYYCKSIINESIGIQYDVFNSIKVILDSKSNYNWQTKAVACYLAGRLTDDGLRKDSIDLLKVFLNENQKRVISSDSDEYDKFLFALRTVYISLAYLGDREAENEYIENLVLKKDWDNVNRGFHLVYYGDQEYIPKNGLAENDNLKDFDRTFEQLKLRISNKSRSNLFNVELFTLISLALARLHTSYLKPNQRIFISSLLKNSNIMDRIDNHNLSSLVSYSIKIFENQTHSFFSPFEDLYNLKFVKRSGWLNRGIKDPESVADHTLFTYYLAKFFLPKENSSIEGYDKNKILDMILIHDIAESKIGDIIRKTEDDKRDEERFYEELKWISYIIPESNDIYIIYDLWNDFEKGITHNGKIARELDRIEAYAQLLYYKCVRNESLSVDQINEWEQSFSGTNSLKYSLTKNIYRIIKKHYCKI